VLVGIRFLLIVPRELGRGHTAPALVLLAQGIGAAVCGLLLLRAINVSTAATGTRNAALFAVTAICGLAIAGIGIAGGEGGPASLVGAVVVCAAIAARAQRGSVLRNA
jgi:hypothetical protein